MHSSARKGKEKISEYVSLCGLHADKLYIYAAYMLICEWVQNALVSYKQCMRFQPHILIKALAYQVQSKQCIRSSYKISQTYMVQTHDLGQIKMTG